eukprot:scaffold67560_cov31-Tisochrysis_lutea.AAC.3
MGVEGPCVSCNHGGQTPTSLWNTCGTEDAADTARRTTPLLGDSGRALVHAGRNCPHALSALSPRWQAHERQLDEEEAREDDGEKGSERLEHRCSPSLAISPARPHFTGGWTAVADARLPTVSAVGAATDDWAEMAGATGVDVAGAALDAAVRATCAHSMHGGVWSIKGVQHSSQLPLTCSLVSPTPPSATGASPAGGGKVAGGGRGHPLQAALQLGRAMRREVGLSSPKAVCAGTASTASARRVLVVHAGRASAAAMATAGAHFPSAAEGAGWAAGAEAAANPIEFTCCNERKSSRICDGAAPSPSWPSQAGLAEPKPGGRARASPPPSIQDVTRPSALPAAASAAGSSTPSDAVDAPTSSASQWAGHVTCVSGEGMCTIVAQAASRGDEVTATPGDDVLTAAHQFASLHVTPAVAGAPDATGGLNGTCAAGAPICALGVPVGTSAGTPSGWKPRACGTSDRVGAASVLACSWHAVGGALDPHDGPANV